MNPTTDPTPAPCRPMVVDPAGLDSLTTPSSVLGSRLPIITPTTAPTSELTSHHLWIAPYQVRTPHTRRRTSVIVAVLFGTALLTWWDHNGTLHEQRLEPGHHLDIPAGIPHAITNPYAVPVVAVHVPPRTEAGHRS